MKAEHRHDLKANDLAKTLITFGDYAKAYGTRIALGIIIVVLVIVLIVRWQTSRKEADLQRRNDIASVRNVINVLTSSPGGVPLLEIENAEKVIERLKTGSDKVMQAEGLVAQGDLAWARATINNVSAQAPTDAQKAAFFKQAREAYQAVLNQHSDVQLAAASAHMGLATLDENDRNWDSARKHYEAIKGMGKGFEALTVSAEEKLLRLAEIQRPIPVNPELVESPLMSAFQLPDGPPRATPPAQTKPSTQPATQPSTQPATLPAAKPETKPATPPASKPATKPDNKTSAKPEDKTTAKPASKPATKPTTAPAKK